MMNIKKITIVLLMMNFCCLWRYSNNITYHQQALNILNNKGLKQASKALKILDLSIKDKNSFEKSSLMAAGVCILCFEQLPEHDEKWLRKGLTYVDSLLSRNSDNSKACVKKAQILFNLGSYNQGALILQKAIRLDPKNIEAVLTYLKFLLEKKTALKALKFAEKMESNFEKTPIVLKAFASVFFEREEWKIALKYYLKSMDVGLTNDYETMFGLGACYFGLERFKDSIHVFENCLRLYPKNYRLFIELAKGYQQLGDWTQSADFLNQYLKYDYQNIMVLEMLMNCQQKLNNPAQVAIIKEKIKKIQRRS